MGARIFRLADHSGIAHSNDHTDVSEGRQDAPARASRDAASTDRYCLWVGASGSRYVHSVYSLLECPEISAANYVLVRRDARGAIAACSVGRVDRDSPSLNLAEIRHKGAVFGATEVHIHLLADTAKRSKLIAFDIESGRQEIGAEPDTRH